MKIGINVLYLLPGVVGGTETYAAGLLRGLSTVSEGDEYVIFVNQEARDWPLPATGSFSRVVCPFSARSRPRRYAFEQLEFPGYLRKHRVDLVHSLGYVGPLRTPCGTVLTVPDLNFRAFGRDMPFVWRHGFGSFVKAAARRADRLVTISEHSRRELAEWLRIPEQEIAVTLLASDTLAGESVPSPEEQQQFERLRPDRPYGLCFSKQSPNKNIQGLLRALARMVHRDDWPGTMVLVGHPPSTFDVDGFCRSLDIRERVVLTGYLRAPVVRMLLRGSQFLVFPSFYEGFGLPILEAMQLGTPVVSSNRSSLPEVGGEAAEYFDTASVEGMAESMLKVSRDEELRKSLKRRGLLQAARFSWEQTARLTLDVYRSLSGGESHA